ncbi:hypothetical protein ACFZAR_36100 [Streptomyces sp. NPDC008222]|uniref:hypothetical protein n=1 Tax=Streptomyces sp. NPDC008222 TaxID=3364820 RepID=UPI0036E94C3A
MTAKTLTDFRNEHPDSSTWTVADMETFEHLAEIQLLPDAFQTRMFQASEQVYDRITDPAQGPIDVTAALMDAHHNAS